MSNWLRPACTRSSGFFGSRLEELPVSSTRMRAKLGHCLALRGEGRLHGPHDLTVVGVDKFRQPRIRFLPNLRRGEHMSLQYW